MTYEDYEKKYNACDMAAGFYGGLTKATIEKCLNETRTKQKGMLLRKAFKYDLKSKFYIIGMLTALKGMERTM